MAKTKTTAPVETPTADKPAVEAAAPVAPAKPWPAPRKANKQASRTIYVNVSGRKDVVRWQPEKVGFSYEEIPGDSAGNQKRRDDACRQVLLVKYPRGLNPSRFSKFHYTMG